MLPCVHFGHACTPDCCFVGFAQPPVSCHCSPSPTENYWTYRCNGEKCVREHYNENTASGKRIPFMSCAMICGEPNIWPMPTGRTKVSSRSLTLSAAAVTLHVDTPFAPVEALVRSAFELFAGDLLLLEANSASAPVERSTAKTRPAAAAGPECTKEATAAAELLAEQQRQQQQQQLARQAKYCDIKHLNVRIAVGGAADVYLSLETDESYNLTVTSAYSTDS